MYYVTITNPEGEEIEVEISEDVFAVFEESRKQEIRYDHERRDHIDKRGLDNRFVIQELDRNAESLEEQYLRKERLEQILNVIESCTPLQKQRFYLYAICGLTYDEIATIQCCSTMAVCSSVRKVKERILKNP